MHKVTKVEVLDNYHLKLTFNEEEERLFDATPYLEKGVFNRLKDKAQFKQAYVQWDTVCWPGELDISPATLYLKSKPIRNLAA
jgi:hypothetical protein